MKFKVGDRVRILRKAKTHAQGWGNSWESECMDATVGKIGRVVSVDPERRDVQVKVPRHDSWGCPEFVLQLAKRAKKVSHVRA